MKSVVGMLIGCLLTACASAPVPVGVATAVRVMDAQFARTSADDAQITVVRDASYVQHWCHVYLSIGGRNIGALLPSQKVTFYLAPGNYLLYAEIGNGGPCAVYRTVIQVIVVARGVQAYDVATDSGGLHILPAEY